MSLADSLAQARTAWHHRSDVQWCLAALGSIAQDICRIPGVEVGPFYGMTIEEKGMVAKDVPAASLSLCLGKNVYRLKIQGQGPATFRVVPGTSQEYGLDVTPEQFALRVLRDAEAMVAEKTLTMV
jgi:hypothetical protein